MTESHSARCVRIVLAEDHTMVRDGMRLLLSLEPGLEVIGEAGDGETAVALTLQLAPDVLVLDYRLPGLDGAGVMRRLNGRVAGLRVLIVSGAAHDEGLRQAEACGADGFVHKSAGSEELVTALQALCAGRRHFDRSAGRPAEPDDAAASGRELQVLGCIASGLNSREIAQRLFISVPTVRKHRENAMRKLDLHNTAEVTAYAIRHGLIDVR
jgi:DNA-binding NarL/FixJ family response regulator